jgi:hypothetical protein
MGKCFPHTRKLVFHIKKSCKKSAKLKHIKIISQINLFLIFLKKTIDKYKIKSNFMCFSVALFYNYFLCGKRAFLCGESNSSKIIFLALCFAIFGVMDLLFTSISQDDLPLNKPSYRSFKLGTINNFLKGYRDSSVLENSLTFPTFPYRPSPGPSFTVNVQTFTVIGTS